MTEILDPKHTKERMDERLAMFGLRPSIGIEPGWKYAADRIATLAGAIQQYAGSEHGAARRNLVRLWAEEIMWQLDNWDKYTNLEKIMLSSEDEI